MNEDAGRLKMGLPEVICICIDNSAFMKHRGPKLKAQVDAIKVYCQAKFEAHSETAVCLYAMSSCFNYFMIPDPTTSMEVIDFGLTRIQSGEGGLDLIDALSFARLPLLHSTLKEKKLRMLFVVGGFTNLSSKDAVRFGNEYKDMGIAVDVINFYLGYPSPRSISEYCYGRTELDTFVNTCNHNDNSHILHLQRSFCINNVLLTSILKETFHLSREENVSVKGDMELSGKNQEATEARGIE